MSLVKAYFAEATRILELIEPSAVERLLAELVSVRARGGRLFVLGVGGSAGNASHAVNDFRKICGIEAYTPTDNVSELTARVNDDGWESTFAAWLAVSKLRAEDMLLVFSVGGGNREQNVSPNLVRALEYGQAIGCRIGGIVGRDGGYTAQVAHACVLIPTVNSAAVTPHSEAFQAVIWHFLVSHPDLMQNAMKWETTSK